MAFRLLIKFYPSHTHKTSLKKIHKMLSYSPFIHIRINLCESISFKHVPINCSFIRTLIHNFTSCMPRKCFQIRSFTSAVPTKYSHIHLETLTSTILPQTFTQNTHSQFYLTNTPNKMLTFTIIPSIHPQDVLAFTQK